MRIARIASPSGPFYARLEGERAHPLRAAPWLVDDASTQAAPVAWADADLLCPVEPTKIICVGRNYAAHARELGNDVPVEPLLFLKPPSSLAGPGGTIVLPAQSTRVEHEAELAVVIGARARNVPASEALDAVFGVTVANDVTARDLQRKDGQWTRAKGFDTFCPVGPWVERGRPSDVYRVGCRVNGEVRQDGLTTQMVFDVASLVAYASSVMTLEPGDLILTGTPEGVGPLVAGDECEVELTDETGGGAQFRLRSRVLAAT